MNWIMERLQKEIKKAQSNNPFEIAKNKKIIIRYMSLGTTLGFYMKSHRHQVITLNNCLDENIEKFVCAHELGHAVLHPNENTPFLHKNTMLSKDKIERQANYFAVNLLLSDKNLADYETKFDVLRDNGIPYEMERFL